MGIVSKKLFALESDLEIPVRVLCIKAIHTRVFKQVNLFTRVRKVISKKKEFRTEVGQWVQITFYLKKKIKNII